MHRPAAGSFGGEFRLARGQSPGGYASLTSVPENDPSTAAMGTDLHIRVLVVTDDAVQRQASSGCLAVPGCFVETACDGIEALRKARHIPFDLVLIDCRLPEVDGAAVARLIRDLPSRGSRPHLVGLKPACGNQPASAPLPGGVFDTVLALPCREDELLSLVAGLACKRQDEASEPCAGGPDGRDRLDPCSPVLQAATDPAAARVLVADDDEVLRKLVQDTLQQAGCDVAIAADGLAAFREIARAPYDVAVLDVQMPQIDGLATARLALDMLSRADRPRLIALTSAPDLLRRREAGTISVFDDILAKSEGVAGLVAAVQRSVAYRRRNQARDPIGKVDPGKLLRLLAPDDAELDPCMVSPCQDGEKPRPPVLDQAALDSVTALLPEAVVAGHLRILARAGGALLGRLRATVAPADEMAVLNATHELAGSAGLLGFKLLSVRSAQYEHASLAAPAEKFGAAQDLREAIELALAEIRSRLLAMADA